MRNTAGAGSGSGDNVVTPEARRALWGSAVGYAMDGFDLLILGFLLKPVSAAFGLGPAQAASLVTVTLAGAVLGGVGFGLLADRLGRVRVLSWSIALFAVFTGLCAMARTYPQLLLCRGAAGLGLGGEFGIGMALVAEAWPLSITHKFEGASAPNLISVRRAIPRHITMLPGGESLARAR